MLIRWRTTEIRYINERKKIQIFKTPIRKMKFSIALLAATATASPDERLFIESPDWVAKTEGWWAKGLQKGWFDPEDYIQEIDDAVPAMAEAIRNGYFANSVRRGWVADNFKRDLAHLTASMRKKEAKCGQNDRVAAEEPEDDRRRRDAGEERAQVGTFGSIEKDFSEIWFDLAKWARNSMQRDCPALVWPVYARIDRFRWTYMRHYCEFVNPDCQYQWALVDKKTGEARPRNFRKQKWFVNKYGSSKNPLVYGEE